MSRDAWFEDLRRRIAEFYLAEPRDPYRMSGRSTGAGRWALKRRCLVDALDGPGDYLDVGCANGLLLESLQEWSGLALVPHGIDFVPELIAAARDRHPGCAQNFAVANVWDWAPTRLYDYLRTNVEYVPVADRVANVQRLAPFTRRLIVCHYAATDEELVDVADVLRQAGLPVTGTTSAPEVAVAWSAHPDGAADRPN
ncbi:MAG: class I SAM-dependent methyltransferase [Planctomycetota bacterium]